MAGHRAFRPSDDAAPDAPVHDGHCNHRPMFSRWEKPRVPWGRQRTDSPQLRCAMAKPHPQKTSPHWGQKSFMWEMRYVLI